LDKSQSFYEQNDNFIKHLYSSFPDFFNDNELFIENGLFYSGSIDSIYQFSKSGINKKLVFFNGNISNREYIEKEYLKKNSAKSLSDAFVMYELLNNHGNNILKKVEGEYCVIYANLPSQVVNIINNQHKDNRFYYYSCKSIFLFSSEIKFIIMHPEYVKHNETASFKKINSHSIIPESGFINKTDFKDIFLFPKESKLSINYNNSYIKLDGIINESIQYPSKFYKAIK
jgi:asparagine synthetase B (glutamine-hydrolysing)